MVMTATPTLGCLSCSGLAGCGTPRRPRVVSEVGLGNRCCRAWFLLLLTAPKPILSGGEYLNDVHVMSFANESWYPLHVAGSPPVPRAGHTATLSPDGQRVIVYGGMDARGMLSDAHALDLSKAREPIWWQLIPAGTTPQPRHSHTATFFGSDLLVVGGMPPAPAEGGVAVELLNLVELETQTSASIAQRIFYDRALNSSCSLLLGSRGSPVQRWTCGAQLRRRPLNTSASDVGADYYV